MRSWRHAGSDLEAYINNTAPKAMAVPGPGHNGWMMTSAALVLFMTLPGLALFYGGLVRRKNILSVVAQCFGCAGLVTILWWAFGYSAVFASGGSVLGSMKFAFLHGVGAAPNPDYGAWVSQSVFAMYQMMFAIITPALIVGAIAERMKYSALMAFILGWMLLIYFPLAHMVWGVDGFMNGLGNPRPASKPSTSRAEPWCTCRRVGRRCSSASFSARARASATGPLCRTAWC